MFQFHLLLHLGAGSGLLLILLIGVLANVNLNSTICVYVDGNRPGDSFKKYGTQNAFIVSAENARIRKPAGYDAAELKRVAEDYHPTEDNAPAVAPHIVVIMEESFADLSVFGENLDPSEPVTPFYDSLERNCIKGNVLVSTYGGGTGKNEVFDKRNRIEDFYDRIE